MRFRNFRKLFGTFKVSLARKDINSPLTLAAARVGIRSLSIPFASFGGGEQAGSILWRKYSVFAAFVAATTAISVDNFRAENCGIVGVVGSEDASGFLLEGLTILRNRGYDSAGIATIPKEGEEIFITKYASRDSTADSIDLVRNNSSKHVGHVVGIGHTRWATHGGKTDINAHPHSDQHHRIALIHNGTINNAYELKKELQDKGIKFISETDTEIIAQLIGTYLDKGLGVKEAVQHALGR
jgi:glucosamine--fructose-6-phosphate aminotransferase (isomerizing)